MNYIEWDREASGADETSVMPPANMRLEYFEERGDEIARLKAENARLIATVSALSYGIMYHVSTDTLLLTRSALDKAPTTVSDWLKAFGGYTPPPAPAEPPKPEDPRSETLRRAIAADKPLDGYGRRV